MNARAGSVPETYNPWTIVNLVFNHLAANGLHPVIGKGDPSQSASELLRVLGIVPSAQDLDVRSRQRRDDELAALRAKFLSGP